MENETKQNEKSGGKDIGDGGKRELQDQDLDSRTAKEGKAKLKGGVEAKKDSEIKKGEKKRYGAIIIKPQEGPQSRFLASPADIVIYGGAAGGGKTFALLLEPLRHVGNGRFGAVIFRKNRNQIFSEGGLWDTAFKIYPGCGGVPIKTPTAMWQFPSGMKITFSHLEMDRDVLKWQGSQIPLIMFDELTHFSKEQFFYMLSRNRSDSGVRGYIRASTNPDADSWVAEFIGWWWDRETGYPIPERSGVIRWLYRRDDALYWAATKEEICEEFGLATEAEKQEAKSVTFIASSLEDNRILMEKDPGYLGNLKALSTVERERLLYGNWKIKKAAGLYFPREKAALVDKTPGDVVQWVRAWDFAATADRKSGRAEDGPAYTAGVLIGRRRNGRYVIGDVINRRMDAGQVRQAVYQTAIADRAAYQHIRIRISQDPGQAGKDQAEQYLKLLSGFSVRAVRESGSKETRAEPFSAQWIGLMGAEKGNVDVVLGSWTESFLSQMESFPEGRFKDMADAASNGFQELFRGWRGVIPPESAAGGFYQSPWIR